MQVWSFVTYILVRKQKFFRQQYHELKEKSLFILMYSVQTYSQGD